LNKDIEEMANVLEDSLYKNQGKAILEDLNKKNVDNLSTSKEKIRKMLRDELDTYANPDGSDISEEKKEEIISLVEKNLWGYGIIDDLIQDKSISDIKLYDYDHIRVKRKGKRMDAGITFADKQAFNRFTTRLLERNHVNLGTANAVQTFTDPNQARFILRITVMSSFLTDSGKPCIAIRKIPKKKCTLEELKKLGMFKGFGHPGSEEKLINLLKQTVNSKGVLFTGKGAAGKTTLLNALIAEIPKDESIMICQENAELFDDEHPDLSCVHVVTNGADSKVSYNLGDLTRASLLMDLDRVIVGEIKGGDEAAGLSKASMTGHKCMTSVHGESCEMAVDKMADYISQATGYSIEESKRQLLGFEYVVHLHQFNVDEVCKIKGVDNEGKLELETVYTKRGRKK